MSDTIDAYKSMADHKKRLRAKYGVACPVCKRRRPKASATIMLPQQRCRVEGYTDPRPNLSDEEWSAA